MRNHVRSSRSERTQPASEEGHEHDLALAALLDDESEDSENTDEIFDDDLGDVVRLYCPDCAQPIAVYADEDHLPEHALCPTPWNPFGLTVCAGSGRAVEDGRPLPGAESGQDPDQDRELAVVLTLPAELDWRTQPFSHVGGPGSRPMRVPAPRLAA
jgi:hypothetical protein